MSAGLSPLVLLLTACSPKVRLVPVEHTRVEWRDRWRVDTVNTGRIDSVRVTEVVEVPAKLTAWQACQLKAFAPLVAIAVLLLAWVTRRLWLPFAETACMSYILLIFAPVVMVTTTALRTKFRTLIR